MTPRAGRPLLTGLAVAGAVALAWLLPAAAVVTVWPILLFVPGWVLLARIQPRIDAPGRAGLAVVISVAASTHLVYWLSQLAGGYGRGIVFIGAGMLALGCVAGPAGLGLRRPSASAIARNGAALTLAGAAALVVGGVLAAGMWRVTPGGVSSGGSNWSDLGVHLSIAETLNAGANFPPDVPYFSGVPLIYHWFADFHAAILAEAAGIFSVPAMVVQSSVLAAALALLVFSLARLLLRGPRARRAAVIAATLAVFAGGLGYMRFVGDVTAGVRAPLELLANNSYDNIWYDANGNVSWPYFRIPSVMGTGLLAHRATTAGLPIVLGAVLLLVAGLPTARQRLAGWRDRPWLIFMAGFLGALLAPFHFFFFPVFPLLALAWVIAGGRLLERAALRNTGLLVAPYLLAAPFVLPPLAQAAGSGALRIVSGWASAPLADGLPAIVFFYVTNLGVPFALALVALFLPRLPHRGFLAAWIIGLFLIPNVVQVSVVDFDMNKYFQAMWIAVGLLAAWLMRRWPLPAVVAVVALSIPSPMLVATWTAISQPQVLTATELAASRWVADNTPPGAVFVTDGWVNSLTDAAGRRRLTTFGPYVANLGYRPDERISDVLSIYCGGDPARSANLMRHYGASYVIDGGRPQPCEAPVDFGASPTFDLVYDTGPLIWRLAEP